MNQPLHHRLPSRELAAGHRTLAGRIDAAELAPRLAEALASEHPAGTVDYELSFAPGPEAGVAVTGHLQARLKATCQRCLRSFMLDLEVPVEVLLDVPEAPRPEDDGPPWDAAGASGSLGELIEEELLLALPFLPRHPPQACAPAGEVPGAETAPDEDRQRPFAGLREALDAARDGSRD